MLWKSRVLAALIRLQASPCLWYQFWLIPNECLSISAQRWDVASLWKVYYRRLKAYPPVANINSCSPGNGDTQSSQPFTQHWTAFQGWEVFAGAETWFLLYQIMRGFFLSLGPKWLWSCTGGCVPTHSMASVLGRIFLWSLPPCSCPSLWCRMESRGLGWPPELLSLREHLWWSVITYSRAVHGRRDYIFNATLHCGIYSSSKQSLMLWGMARSLEQMVFIQWWDLRKVGSELWQNQAIFQSKVPDTLDEGA